MAAPVRIERCLLKKSHIYLNYVNIHKVIKAVIPSEYKTIPNIFILSWVSLGALVIWFLVSVWNIFLNISMLTIVQRFTCWWDTDLLIQMCYYYHKNTAPKLFFMPEPKKGWLNPRTYMSIGKAQEVLGESVCENILFAHAILVADTASRLFRIGKGLGLKVLKDNNTFIQQVIVFCNLESMRWNHCDRKKGNDLKIIRYFGWTKIRKFSRTSDSKQHLLSLACSPPHLPSG